MSIVNKPQIIVAAIASRPYVEAAIAAGFEVVAIDAFADLDTLHIAKACYEVDLRDDQLCGNQLLHLLDGMDLKQFIGLCYGAGFEKTPHILNKINERIAVIGNVAQVVGNCKTAHCFFNVCDNLSIMYPPVEYELPLHPNGWLQKETGGSGGGHIQQISFAQEVRKSGIYYQALQIGKPVSCLFLASKGDVQVVGISEQWTDINQPESFRYGGAVSHVEISECAKTRLIEYVRKLSQAIGLVGLNSCDVICDGDDIYVLEINPRLSATIDLYITEYPRLMAMHIDASHGRMRESLPKIDDLNKKSTAHQVIYALHDVTISDNIHWPAWVKDVPQAGNYFKAEMPICTVFAIAETALLAKKRVQDRTVELNKKLLN